MALEHQVQHCTCFNVRKAARIMGQLYDRALQDSGLTNTQFSLLATAQGRGRISITELASELGMDRSTLSRNLRLLDQRSLVRLTRGRDARTRTVAVTAAGAKALQAAMPSWRKAQSEVVDSMESGQWPLVLRSLQTLSRHGEHLLASEKRQ